MQNNANQRRNNYSIYKEKFWLLSGFLILYISNTELTRMLVNLIDLVSSLQQVGPAHGKYKMNENIELSHTTRISLKPERTRFFRSSHPMPPAPTTRIFPFFIKSRSTDGAASAMFRRIFDFEMRFVLTFVSYILCDVAFTLF